MSTAHQKYSTENQAAVIAVYAERRGFEIVRTYADQGRSGLNLDGRKDLQCLLEDVQGGRADFEAILVYDVSRWGRFQDVDEAAAYEYACRRAGIAVHYCAEEFENDGSMPANVMKVMKRAMAGEYSRELSAKVFLGQCRLVELGFRQGGSAGYGLRRLLLNDRREPKGQLHRGEQKSIQTDRVILVPGPEGEVATVRRIYEMFISGSRTEAEIAAALNREGVRAECGHSWTRGMIHEILTNEKYAGHNVFNRVSFKLKKGRIVNPPERWVRSDHAFEAIVAPEAFLAAGLIIEERNRRFSDAEMLDLLRSLLGRTGWLSGFVIDEAEGMPSSSAYQHRFGSLVRAYSLVGYTPSRDYSYIEVNRKLRALHPGVVADTIDRIETIGGAVARDPATDLLTVNDEFTVSVVIARCLHTPGSSLRWKVRLDAGLAPDITVALRMDEANEGVHDYYLLPRIGLDDPKLRLAEENGALLDAYRFDTLDFLVAMAARADVRSAA